MGIAALLQWQWKDYAKYHQHKTSLMLHIVAVPLFMVANLLLLVGLFNLSAALSIAAIAGIGLSLAIQGRAHKMEPVPSVPFSGPVKAISRLFFEQWITFPRFVLSGGWYRNFTRAG